MRRIRSRVNALDFMNHFCDEGQVFDDYWMGRWEMFRDDPVGFWCHSSEDNQRLFEELVLKHAAEELSFICPLCDEAAIGANTTACYKCEQAAKWGDKQ